jgi:hypothetical protein
MCYMVCYVLSLVLALPSCDTLEPSGEGTVRESGEFPYSLPKYQIGDVVEYIKLGVHIWVSVLIMGTLWRVISYHLIASTNENLVHLGRAMAQQY